MRALAEYVMRGRAQAVFVAAFATGTVLFAWVAAAVIGLIILRKGIQDAAIVLLWALLPAVVVAAMGDIGPLTTLLGAALVAVVLRVTASWPLALGMATLIGSLTAVSLLAFGQGYIEEILALLGEMVSQVQTAEQSQAEVGLPSVIQIAGLLGFSNTLMVVWCLILARWWQSMLYNPGGFQGEFHSLRMPPQLTVVLLAAGVLLFALGSDYRYWALLFAVPFVFAGFGLVHCLAVKKQLGGNTLVLFYVAWLLLDPLKALLLIVAVADSWLNIRARLVKS